MLGHAVLRILAQVRACQHGRIERLFLRSRMGADLYLELIEQFFQPVGIVFRVRHLGEKLTMRVMILFQAVENRAVGHHLSSSWVREENGETGNKVRVSRTGSGR